MKRLLVFTTVIVALAVLAGCASTPTPAPQIDGITQPPSIQAAQPIATTTEAASGSTTTQPAAKPVAQSCELTPADMEGPYYKAGAPIKDGSINLSEFVSGDKLTLTGVVYLEGCQNPLAGAIVEIWQADSQGTYDNNGYTLRGGVKTGTDGAYTFETIMPGYYEPRPLHIHLKASAPNAVPLTTQIYFLSDTGSADMPVLLRVSPLQDGSVLKAVFNIVLGKK